MKHSTPRLPKIMDSQKYSNSNIDWNLRIPTNPHEADIKVNMPLVVFKEDAILPDDR